ncbi:acyloxyacyl hydrolase [Aliiglaciecola sp. M165]|uniref:acyloxyacyl hydrolase n=1 Tax=Aliiglaciecola sp. M165 TaxID=2593649 RepID=UPI00117BFADA|nr:acyloxyacyl hydrolase [Aliiglaciecola sp. M165]TRY33266.1 acyloxyacyl hydrolase [Aliiglaciecola sp. M165]
MARMNYLNQHNGIREILFIFSAFFLIPSLSYSDTLNLKSVSVRARVSDNTLLGKDAQEDFKEYDFSVNFQLPWTLYSSSDWRADTRMMTSAGVLRGAGKNALVVSAIPELVIGHKSGWFNLDLGAGAALFSRQKFGVQDFGGPFQFALTLGVNLSLSQSLGLGYRFLHYSDAGVNGSNTTGADFHMIEFTYKL